jgi:hypothetical protein
LNHEGDEGHEEEGRGASLSYDLMVFDAAAAPHGRQAFIEWYQHQTQWTETHGYNNPDVPTPSLRAWFQEMIKSFPPMNGPLASDDVDDPKVTDYSLGQSVIYCAFAWSEAEAAHALVKELAAKHRVGFFDVSSNEAEIWLPMPNGGFEMLSE